MEINTYSNKESKVNSLDFIKYFEMNGKTHTYTPISKLFGYKKKVVQMKRFQMIHLHSYLKIFINNLGTKSKVNSNRWEEEYDKDKARNQ